MTMETLWDVFWSTFEDVQIEPHGYIPAGSEVVVPNTVQFRGRDGIELIARNGSCSQSKTDRSLAPASVPATRAGTRARSGAPNLL
jgi:hypothetical protein